MFIDFTTFFFNKSCFCSLRNLHKTKSVRWYFFVFHILMMLASFPLMWIISQLMFLIILIYSWCLHGPPCTLELCMSVVIPIIWQHGWINLLWFAAKIKKSYKNSIFVYFFKILSGKIEKKWFILSIQHKYLVVVKQILVLINRFKASLSLFQDVLSYCIS